MADGGAAEDGLLHEEETGWAANEDPAAADEARQLEAAQARHAEGAYSQWS